MRTVPTLASIALLLALPAGASAQPADDHRVTVEDVRVDGQPLPASLQPLLQGPLETTLEPIRTCYRARTAQRPDLTGTLRLSMWVSNRQVVRVSQEASTLNDPPLERCVTDEIRGYRLPDTAPAGGAQVQGTVRFERGAAPVTPAGPVGRAPEGSPFDLGQVLSGLPPGALDVPRGLLGALPPGLGSIFGGATEGGASTPSAAGTPSPAGAPIAPPAAPARVSITVLAPRGELEAERIAEGLGQQSAPLRACYEAAQARAARLGSALRVTLSIGPDGAVRRAAPSTGLRDRLATACVQRVLREARFTPTARATRASAELRFAP